MVQVKDRNNSEKNESDQRTRKQRSLQALIAEKKAELDRSFYTIKLYSFFS